MEFKTTKCSLFNHPEFHFSVDMKSIPEQDVTWLISHLEGEVAKGVIFKTDETIQLGYMLIKILKSEENYFRLLEPNMIDTPIVFKNSITNTLKYFRQQQDIVDSFQQSLTIDFPSIQESIIVNGNFESSQSYYLNRERKEDNQSGWFFRDISENAIEDVGLISLYEFSCKRPDTIKFLGLPEGIGILKRELDITRIIKKDVELEISESSYLQNLNYTQ